MSFVHKLDEHMVNNNGIYKRNPVSDNAGQPISGNCQCGLLWF